MLILLSPAKALDYNTPHPQVSPTQPMFLDPAEQLIELLRQKSPQDIAQLMDLSDKLAQLNVGRYHSWQRPFDQHNSRPAVFAFDGDVYAGLDARTLNDASLLWLQQHVRILSGLYGLLRPFDWMQAYRLEMGTALPNAAGRDLYAHWRPLLAPVLAAELADDPLVINAASDEYSKAVDFARLGARVIQPVFKDWKNGQYKIISFYAKTARGLFARYAAQQQASAPEALKAFDLAGYQFDPASSTEQQWVFLRRGAE
jgi:uncharacterized protein